MRKNKDIKRKIDVIAYRSNGKESKKIEWFFIVFAAICVGLFIFCFVKTDLLTKGMIYYKILTVICGVLGLINIIFSITTLITIRKNNKNKQICVGISPDKRILIYDIKENEIKIKRNQLIKVEKSYFTTNDSIIIFYENNDTINKVNIGWTEDIDAIRRLIIKNEKK